MSARPQVRRLVLLWHVATSVGFLGAVVAFLVLAISGLLSPDGLQIRAAYIAMEMLTWACIVPLSLLSLATGVAISLLTPWGLFRHHWFVIKLAITVVATLLLIHTQPVGHMAQVAADDPLLGPKDMSGARLQLVVASGAAVVALLTTTVLSIYKPSGLTRYGWRWQHRDRDAVGS